MKLHKQAVYLPVKVEDDSTFLITKEISNYLQYNSSIDFHKNGKCTYTPVFITETSKESEELEHLIIERLDKKEGYFFTPEQLNQYTQSIIKQALETAAENADLAILKKSQYSKKARWKKVSKKEAEEGVDLFSYEIQYKPSKKSITNTFEETYKKFEV